MTESKKDRTIQGEPNLLDGSPLCPRQNLEGKTDQQSYENYKKHPYAVFLTYNEFYELEYELSNDASRGLGPKYYTYDSPSVRVKKCERYFELLDKLDLQKIHDDLEKRLQEQRVARASARVVNRYELGAREFTFTYSPKWFNDAEARLQMSSAIQKLVKYYKEEIIQLRAIGEVGSAGLSHIHCFYKLKNGKKITDKNFSRAYKMWDTKKKTGPSGHQGGHHQTVKNESDFSGYIDKDIENAWFEVNIDSSLDPQ